MHIGDARLDIEGLLRKQGADVHVYVCGPMRLIDAVANAGQRLD